MLLFVSMLLSKKFFKESFFLILVVAIANYIAVEKDLYWTIREFDSAMHFLGGAWVALSFIFIYYFSGLFNPGEITFWKFVYIAFLGTLFVSVAWEIYELAMGTTFATASEYSYDTALDFIMDGLGALAASMYAFAREVSNERREFAGDALINVKNE